MSKERSVLVPLPPVQWGGLHAFAANLNADLRKAGWRWTVIVPPEAGEVRRRLSDSGVETISAALPRLRRSPLLSLKALAGLASSVRALAGLPQCNDAIIVQAVGAHHFHAPLLAGRLHKPLVWQIHSNLLPGPLRRFVAPYITARADAVMTNGRAVASAFWRKTDQSTRQFVFYAPVDAPRFAANSEARATGRRTLGYDEDTILVGTVGNRVRQKNHRLLVSAARELSHLYPRLRFLVLGAVNTAYERQYETTVVAEAESLNRQFPGYVRFLDPGTRVDYWIQPLDIFALTSHAEGVPIALFEAMCAAKPVVTSRVGSIQEIVVHGHTGFLFQSGDRRTLVEQILTLFEDRALRDSMGCFGRDRISQEFSMSRVVEAHVAAYEGAIAAYRMR